MKMLKILILSILLAFLLYISGDLSPKTEVKPFKVLVYTMQLADDNEYCLIDVNSDGEVVVSAGDYSEEIGNGEESGADYVFWKGKLSPYKCNRINELLEKFENCGEHNELCPIYEGIPTHHFVLFYGGEEYRTEVWSYKIETDDPWTDSNYIIQMLGFELCDYIPFNGTFSEYMKWCSVHMIKAKDEFERVYKPFLGDWDVSVWKTNVGWEFVCAEFAKYETVENPDVARLYDLHLLK